MQSSDFVSRHIVASLIAAMAEANGDEETAKRLNAQARMRLLLMSDAERWKLAEMTAAAPLKSAEEAYAEISQAIEMHRATADAWVPYVRGMTNLPTTAPGSSPLVSFDLADLQSWLSSPES